MLPGPAKGLLGLTSARKFRVDPLGFLQSLARDFGEIAYFQLGTFRAVFINHPDLIHEVLVKQQKQFPKLSRQTKTIRLLDGDNLFVKQGPVWLRQRRLVQAGFHPTRMPSYANVIVDFTRRRMSQWKTNTPIDFSDEMIDLALTIITKTMFDVELGNQTAELRKLVYHRSKLFLKEMGTAVRLPDWLPVPSKWRKHWVIRKTDQLIYPEIRKRRDAGEYRDDLLSALMTAIDDDGQGMSDQEVRDEATLLFHAGLDDVASALAWMFYLLATHPEEQERLASQAKDVLSGRDPVVEDMQKLGFAELVVKETLRLYPSTWIFTARRATDDTQIGQYPIKKGSWVFISPMVTQRDQRFFAEPNRFLPERFSEIQLDQITRNAWFPFGMGPRVCVGSSFAMMELMMIASMVVKEFYLEMVPGQGPIEPSAQVTVRPKRGVKLLLHSR